jgi:hypothetical protein
MARQRDDDRIHNRMCMSLDRNAAGISLLVSENYVLIRAKMARENAARLASQKSAAAV